MEGTLENAVVKDLSETNTQDLIHKDSKIVNGLNGGYNDDELENDSSTDNDIDDAKELALDNSKLNKIFSNSTADKDIANMEVDSSEEQQINENDDESVHDNMSHGDFEEEEQLNHVSVDEHENFGGGGGDNVDKCDEVLNNDKRDSKGGIDEDEAMELDAQSNASDIEYLESVNEDELLNSDNDNDNVKKTVNSSDDRRGSETISSSLDKSDVTICEENGECNSPDIQEIESENTKSNGPSTAGSDKQSMSIDTKEISPKKKQSKPKIDLSQITPRRSSRNINRKSYTEKEPEPEPEEIDDDDDDDDDIEEIKPIDPLGDPLADITSVRENKKSSIKSISSIGNKTTIVVNDTKRLVEIAAGSKNSRSVGGSGSKKEPTLVIIDTNSILSGRGGVPVSSTPKSSHHSSNLSTSSSFSMVPISINPQTQIYPNMRTTITPVPMNLSSLKTASQHHSFNSSKSTTISPIITQPSPQNQSQQILPTLTDDMFVVEAPSFIVPYVYEKPPLKPMKEFVKKLEKSISDFEKEEKLKKEKEKEKEKENDKVSLEADKDKGAESDSVKCKSDKNNTIDLTHSSHNKSIEEIYDDSPVKSSNKMPTYFDLPLGKFFMQIGMNLVQEFVQTDLLRTQKSKQRKQGAAATSVETQMAINSLIKNLEFSKENNEPFHLEMKKCEFCNFKTESALVMQHHLETPHMRNYMYKCNFCTTEVRSPHEILFHMEEVHNIRGRLERGPAFHQCPNCPFEDNQKGKLSRHILACTKKFRPDRNLEPALDFEPPAKIPRLNRPRTVGPPANVANAFAMAMAPPAHKNQQPLLPKLLPASVNSGRGRGRPPMQPRYPDMKALRPGSSPMRPENLANMMYRPTSSGLLVPAPYQFGGNQIFQNTTVTHPPKNPTAKLLSQPSISITPLPRTTPQAPIQGSGSSSKSGAKNTFVICEICDGYIKDLEQLRNHMQWIHKVKIHPKMIYNRPPLNCQKCQFRFFTDQGLERHLLGSHGLVTSSMQEAANKGKDAGRCPACGRVYQWKLLNHVARDHGMTLKPAHLSYKCTVCTATFGMYKQFENHVYSAHSVVAKRVMDKKTASPSSSQRSTDSLLKPLKINDEITIIAQPAKPARSSQGRASK